MQNDSGDDFSDDNVDDGGGDGDYDGDHDDSVCDDVPASSIRVDKVIAGPDRTPARIE